MPHKPSVAGERPSAPKPPPPTFPPAAPVAGDLGIEVNISLAEPSPGRLSSRHVFPWRLMLAVTFCALGIGYLIGELWPWQPAADLSSDVARDGAKALQPGPWGDLRALPIYIEPPEELLPVRGIEQADRRWRFEGFTPDQLTALFQKADLTDAQRAELLDISKWQQDGKAIEITPSNDLLLSLSPQARKVIYAPLVASPGDIYSLFRCSIPADHFAEFFANSGLPDETIALIRKLSYPYGHLIFFCDLPLVMDTLPTADLKLRLVRTLLKKSTLLLRLHVSPESNIEELTHYWVRAGTGVSLRPLLESLVQVPKGTSVNIALLLPPKPASELYTFPLPSTNPQDALKDCHFVALNFFRDTPDPRFTDPAAVHQTLLSDYYPVLADPRYGDLVLLTKPNGDIIHSCVFIADNIVYTKNSASFRDPYLLMTIPDMLDSFESQIPEGETLEVHCYRNKYY